jgi:uncharacterized damage-inducible protein DinB
MKDYLLKTFRYNDWANTKLLEAIGNLPDKEEAFRLFSHLVHAQNKWYNRVTKKDDDVLFNWFGESFPIETIANDWKQSLYNWIVLLEKSNPSDLDKMIEFTRAIDGKLMGVKLADLMLQLNYHSIHHRAQINALISKQGQKPPLTDYIFTVLKEL